jgi:dethiobiotin synthetase
MARGFFITGTDTGIGKTFIACAMIKALQARGLQVAPMKPVAAGTIIVDGVVMNEDVADLMAATDHQFLSEDVNPYCLKEAIAPHIAALRENVDIEMDRIAKSYTVLAAQSDMVLVEGAGGFLVPMNEMNSMADLPRHLDLDVIIVVGMRLGCLNHALLTAEAVRARGLAVAGWVANTPGEAMSAFEDNLATLQVAMGAPHLGTVPHLGDSKPRNAIHLAGLAARHLDLDPLF